MAAADALRQAHRGAQAADRPQPRRGGDPGRGRAGAGGGGGRDHRRAVRHRPRARGCSRRPCRSLQAQGQAEVTIAGRRSRSGRDLVTDLAGQDQARRIRELGRALAGHARARRRGGRDRERIADLRRAARHPKSFVSLDTADHLLSRREDAAYAARVLAAWASRYVGPARGRGGDGGGAEEGVVRVEETGRGRFQQRITAGRNSLIADEPASVGGMGVGLRPLRSAAGGGGRLLGDDRAPLCRAQGLAAGAGRGRAAPRQDPRQATAPTARPRATPGSTRSTSGSRSPGRWMRSSGRGWSRSPAAARCTARSSPRSRSAPRSRHRPVEALAAGAAAVAAGHVRSGPVSSTNTSRAGFSRSLLGAPVGALPSELGQVLLLGAERLFQRQPEPGQGPVHQAQARRHAVGRQQPGAQLVQGRRPAAAPPRPGSRRDGPRA